jgi:HD-like signal output (HDOD) protein
MPLALNEILTPQALEDLQLANTLFDVLSLLKTEHCDFKQVSASVQDNPKFSKRILSRANSNNYGFDKPIRDLQHAVAILGFARVKTALLQSTDRSFYHRYLDIEGPLGDLKKHSVAVACYAEEYAKEMRQVYPPEFYKAGLQHDLGSYALLMAMGKDYIKLVQEAESMNYSLYLHERDQLKFDHAELGYQIAVEWQLSECIQNVIRFHHQISEERKEQLTTREVWILDTVHFANLAHRAQGPRTSRSLYRDLGSDMPRPPGEPTIEQLKRVNEYASTRALESFRKLGLLS